MPPGDSARRDGLILAGGRTALQPLTLGASSVACNNADGATRSMLMLRHPADPGDQHAGSVSFRRPLATAAVGLQFEFAEQAELAGWPIAFVGREFIRREPVA
jgi:hypothetical protein